MTAKKSTFCKMLNPSEVEAPLITAATAGVVVAVATAVAAGSIDADPVLPSTSSMPDAKAAVPYSSERTQTNQQVRRRGLHNGAERHFIDPGEYLLRVPPTLHS